MRQAWHDLRFNVFLYVGPFFPVFWWATGKKFVKIAWGNIGDDSSTLDCVAVVNYWELVSSFHLWIEMDDEMTYFRR